MKYVVLFRDAADADPNIRAVHMAAHLEFLEQHSATIDAAGPLTDKEGNGRDGLWIVDAVDQNTVKDLIHEDPFWPTGLRASFSILPWKQVFHDGRRLIEG